MARYDIHSRYRVNPDKVTADRVAFTGGNYTVHVIRAGESLESLALVHLGSTRRYWEIADLNPQIKFPTDLEIGMYIRLPK